MTDFQNNGPQPLRLLGVTLHDASRDDLETLFSRAKQTGHQKQVVTINPEFLVASQNNDRFRQVLNEADLSVVDGVGLVYAGVLHGRILHRLTGVDLVYGLCEKAAKEGLRVFLLGASPGVAAQAAEALVRKYPGLQVDYSSGSTNIRQEGAEERARVIAEVRAAAPDFLFVAYGAPWQDIWIADNKEALGVPISVGVGGTFDYIAGLTYRAPRLLRWLGFEWLVRLVRQPLTRGRRIWQAVIIFPLLVVREWVLSADTVE